MRLILAHILFLLGSNGSANVIYDEAINGDLPGDPFDILQNDFLRFRLATGLNIVRGSGKWLNEEPDPNDGFDFILAGGQSANISISATFRGLDKDEDAAWVWEIKKIVDDETPYSTELLGYHTSNTSEGFGEPNSEIELSDLKLDADLYRVNYNFRFADVNDPSNFDYSSLIMDYEITIEVSELPNLVRVPIPPVALLIIITLYMYFGFLTCLKRTPNKTQKLTRVARLMSYRSPFCKYFAFYSHKGSLSGPALRNRQIS